MKMTVTLVFLLVFVASSIAEPNSDGPAGEKLHQYHSDVGMNPLAEYSYSFQPMHVHLAYGADTSEVVVTWSTRAKEAGSIVNWGTSMFRLDKATNGTSKLFEDITKTNVQFIHRVHLMDLAPNTTFFYQVGGGSGWSSVFGFKTVPAANTEWPLRFAAYGDLGVVNAKSLTRLQREAHTGMYDMVLHVGDMAYNMYEENGTTGDDFMDQIQPIAGYLPYMLCPGNHENHDHFLQFRSRFSMPNYPETESIFYSFNIGPVHFVSVSTEVYYYYDVLRDTATQWKWLKKDLEEANTPENRKLRPWIVLFGHRPMYCTTNDQDDCRNKMDKVRVGFKLGNRYQFGIEDLLVENHVDIALWAHEHTYERFYPIYNYTYFNQADAYDHPKAPVHIISGSAGCRENTDAFDEKPPYSAARSSNYGYARFTVHNASHLHMEQVDAKEGTVLDEVMVVRHEGKWNF